MYSNNKSMKVKCIKNCPLSGLIVGNIYTVNLIMMYSLHLSIVGFQNNFRIDSFCNLDGSIITSNFGYKNPRYNLSFDNYDKLSHVKLYNIKKLGVLVSDVFYECNVVYGKIIIDEIFYDMKFFSFYNIEDKKAIELREKLDNIKIKINKKKKESF